MDRDEPLQTYREKRDFARTPEPRGGARVKGKHGLYIIQKHAASHLHYDFRLEMGGVLKSWAVPKGPSCDPGEKRLARQVEDHPVEYGSFEGTIPQGEYGGGTVLLWDRGHWEPEGDPEEGYRRGKLKMQLHGEKLRGGFTLVRMHGRNDEDERNWLLIKERDGTASSADIVVERPESVLSGRTIPEIAADPEAAQWRSNRTPAGTKPAPQRGTKAIKVLAGKAPAAKGRAAKVPAAKGRAAKALAAKVPAAKVRADNHEIVGARRGPMPEAVGAQLATLVTEPPPGDRWLYELKLDGYRLLAFFKDGKVRLETRNGQDWTRRFPTVAEAVAGLPVEQAVIDGEVVVLRGDGVSDFQALQNALRDARAADLVFFAFDLLYRDGYDLRGAELLARKEALARLLAGVPATAHVRYSEHFEHEGADVLAKACQLGAEGVIAKDRTAPYVAGRTGTWLKIKCSHRQELVIGGFTEPSGTRLGLGAVLLGVYDDAGRLVYAGKVGTGFSGKVLRDLRLRLSKLEQDEAPFADPPRMRGAHWVKPEIMAEVRFAGWTRGDRVRQGAFMGIREDRKPKTVVRETPRPPPPATTPRKVATPDKTATARKAETPKKTTARKRATADKTATVRKAETPSKAATPRKTATARKAATVNKATPGKATAARKAATTGKAAAAPRAAGGSGKAVTRANAADTGVELTHPDKVLYPEEGITKRQLADYYAQVAPFMLPLAGRRPLTLVRCPNGQGKPCFFQKHAMPGLTDDIGQVPIAEGKGEQPYLYVETAAGLVSLVQIGALELHVWGSRIDHVEEPDLLVFDLDPGPEVTWEEIVEGARTVRTLLDALGLSSFVKTTGGKGLHVTLPVRPERDWDEVRAFAKAVATMLERAAPDRYVVNMAKAKRTGKVFVDYLRNGRGATAVAPYSTRARPGGYVAMPVSWDELGSIEPATFTIASVPDWLARRGDPWSGLPSVKQSLTDAMMRKVGA